MSEPDYHHKHTAQTEPRQQIHNKLLRVLRASNKLIDEESHIVSFLNEPQFLNKYGLYVTWGLCFLFIALMSFLLLLVLMAVGKPTKKDHLLSHVFYFGV